MTPTEPPSDPILLLYRQVILDHKRRPRNRGPVDGANRRGEASNPVCGDHLILEAREVDGRLEALGVVARGCAISVAAGSILTELLTGKARAEVDALREVAERIVRGGDVPPGEYGDLGGLEGVRAFPARHRCALLAWEALDEALDEARGEARGEAGEASA